jgi:hypothetical protein
MPVRVFLKKYCESLSAFPFVQPIPLFSADMGFFPSSIAKEGMTLSCKRQLLLVIPGNNRGISL